MSSFLKQQGFLFTILSIESYSNNYIHKLIHALVCHSVKDFRNSFQMYLKDIHKIYDYISGKPYQPLETLWIRMQPNLYSETDCRDRTWQFISSLTARVKWPPFIKHFKATACVRRTFDKLINYFVTSGTSYK